MNDSATPIVSVVIPCFNQGHFLGEAIGSVLAQTYPKHEVIVVDDGSRDNSYEVAGRYPDVRRLRHAHCGVAASRNLGLREARGDFIMFLDADDRLLPHAIELGVEALARRPQIAAAVGMSRDIGSDGRVIREGGQSLVTQDHYLHLLEDCYIWSGSSIVYRQAAVEAVTGFDETLRAGDDYDLYLRLTYAYPVFCHDSVVTEYRRHGSNTTRDPAVVLTSQLQVLRAQRPLLRNGREQAARDRGIRNTRSAHGRALAERVVRDWRDHRRRRALAGLATLARCDPRAIACLGAWRA